MKRKPSFYYCPTWKMNYHFFLGWPADVFEAFMRKHYDHETSMKGCAGRLLRCDSDQGTILLIWVRKRSDAAVLAHECVHAANETLKSRGCRADFENDEPQAYLVEALMRAAIA